MMKKKCILFLFFIYSPFVFSCKEYVSGEIICELNEGDKKLSIQFLKKGCEFPKGNKTDCLYAKSCLNGEVKIGTAIYTNQNSSKDLVVDFSAENLYNMLTLERWGLVVSLFSVAFSGFFHSIPSV